MKRFITTLFTMVFILAISYSVEAVTNDTKSSVKTVAVAYKIDISKCIYSISEVKCLSTDYREVFAIPITYNAAKGLINSSSQIKPQYTSTTQNKTVTVTIKNCSTKLNYKKSYTYCNGGVSFSKSTANKVIIKYNLIDDKEIKLYTVKAKTIYKSGKYYFKTYLVISLDDKIDSTNANSGENNSDDTIGDTSNNSSGSSSDNVIGNTSPTPSPNDSVNINEPNLQRKLIVLDAGHGGKDPGACGNSLKEKDVNIDITYLVKSLLEQRGYDVFLTRDSDYFVELSDRSELANILNADLFVSIHNNSNGNKNYKGTTVLYNSSAPKPAADLAEMMRDLIADNIGTTKLTLENRPNLVVLNSTYMPAVLAEVGVLSNSSDAAKLKDDKTLELAAEGIVQAIDSYLSF